MRVYKPFTAVFWSLHGNHDICDTEFRGDGKLPLAVEGVDQLEWHLQLLELMLVDLHFRCGSRFC